MSWFRKAYNRGIPLMDEYSRGEYPASSAYKKDPRSLVTPKPEFGGNQRPGYPKGISSNPNIQEDDKGWEEMHGRIPGEPVLMDDGGDSREGLGERFTAQDEFNTDNDTIPEESKRKDNIDIGPHNMQGGNIFKKMKNKIKTRGIRI
jgi:hypothetical protein